MPRRTCMFCGGRANSKEHAWPEWTLKWVDRGLDTTMHAQFGEQADVLVLHNSHLTVRYVCKEHCNEGWMSRLETAAIPVLRPLITDLSVPMDRAAQTIAAIWTTKTAMVFGGMRHRARWFYTDAEREYLMSSHAIPPNTVIWIGRNANSGSLYALANYLTTQRDPASPFTNAYVTTIGIGRLVLQILSLRGDRPSNAMPLTFETRPGPWRDSLIQIWPIQSRVTWPPAGSFSTTSTSLDMLSERFSPRTQTHL